MAFGLNKVQIIGRLGADVTVNALNSGGRVANMSVATDESFLDRNGGGQRVDRTEWHRVVTFQDGLIEMLERHARKGRSGLCRGQAADPAVEEGGRGDRALGDRDPARAGQPGTVLGEAQRCLEAGRG